MALNLEAVSPSIIFLPSDQKIELAQTYNPIPDRQAPYCVPSIFRQFAFYLDAWRAQLTSHRALYLCVLASGLLF